MNEKYERIMVQELLKDEPWKLLAGCILLNRTTGTQVKNVIDKFFERFDSIDKLALASTDKIAEVIASLGFQSTRSVKLKAFAHEYMYRQNASSGKIFSIDGVPGIGQYAKDSYEIFIKHNYDIQPEDKELKRYLDTMSIEREFSALENAISNDVLLSGLTVIVGGRKTMEVCGYNYKAIPSALRKMTRHESSYIDKKFNSYERQAIAAVEKLKLDIYSRQAVLQFSVAGEKPNCFVCAQILVRRGLINIYVFQRSQDVERVEADCAYFAKLMRYVQERLNKCYRFPIGLGEINVSVGSMHKYI